MCLDGNCAVSKRVVEASKRGFSSWSISKGASDNVARCDAFSWDTYDHGAWNRLGHLVKRARKGRGLMVMTRTHTGFFCFGSLAGGGFPCMLESDERCSFGLGRGKRDYDLSLRLTVFHSRVKLALFFPLSVFMMLLCCCCCCWCDQVDDAGSTRRWQRWYIGCM